MKTNEEMNTYELNKPQFIFPHKISKIFLIFQPDQISNGSDMIWICFVTYYLSEYCSILTISKSGKHIFFEGNGFSVKHVVF